jgi:hypothetical protein
MSRALPTTYANPMPGIYSDRYPVEYQQYAATYGNQLNRVGWKFYDTQTYVSGTTTALTQWFNVRATIDLSNMEVAFQLAAPKAFLVRSFRFWVKQVPQSLARAASTNPQTGAFSNIALLCNTGVLTFTVNNVPWAIEPLWTITSGGGPTGVISLEGATADPGAIIDYAQNGIADPRAVNTLAVPIFIPPQINFTAQMTWPAALTLVGGNTPISLVIEGDLLRPISG